MLFFSNSQIRSLFHRQHCKRIALFLFCFLCNQIPDILHTVIQLRALSCAVVEFILQILDEGKINDAQGRTVDFSNTVICMTSNAGSSDQSAGSLGFNKSDAQRSEEKTRKALAQFLRPEFLGRVDEVIAFKPLTEQTLQGIAALMLDEYKPGMEAKGIAYSYTPAALKALVQKSQGGRFGARDLRRTIRKAVEDPAAERLIDGTLASGGTLVVDADENGEVVLK